VIVVIGFNSEEELEKSQLEILMAIKTTFLPDDLHSFLPLLLLPLTFHL